MTDITITPDALELSSAVRWPTGSKDSLWIKNGSNWVEFKDFSSFSVKKVMNQISQFDVTVFDIQDTQKAYFKEKAEVLFFVGTKKILKGRIQTIEYGSEFECTAKGYGMEVKLLDKELIKNNDKRVDYPDYSAQSIANEILSSGTTGSAPWIIQPGTDGLFNADSGTLTLRFEYANRLNAIAKLCEAISYEWEIYQSTDYEIDYFRIVPLLGTQTSVKTYNIAGANANCSKTSMEKDITSMVNYIDVLGYGDGINQISTSTYNASPIFSILLTDISDIETNIPLVDSSGFASSGEIRIMEERITYTGNSGNILTGCIRGANSTTAKSHKKNVYVEKYVTVDSAESGSSIEQYGLLDYTLIDKTIINIDTLEVIASGYLLDRMTPIISITITPNEPATDISLSIGDLITIDDAESGIDEDYRIVSLNYVDNYGDISLEVGASNRSLDFIEQLNKAREDAQNISKYMQGSTSLYSLQETENLDNAHPLDMSFFIPEEAISINRVQLNFNQKGWRSYGTTEIIEEQLNNPLTIISIGSIGSEQLINVTASGFASSGTTSAITDTTSSFGPDAFKDWAIKITAGTGVDQLKVVDSNDLHTIYTRTPWETVPDTTSGYAVIVPYTTSQTNLDFTDEIDAIQKGSWANIKFENAGGQEFYDQYNSSIDNSLWLTTNAGTSGRVTASTLTETDNYIEGLVSLSASTTSANYNVGVKTKLLPALDDMAEVSFRVQRGASIPLDASDGTLTFTTTTKSYGTMSEGVDYNVSGNNLYLFPDRQYNFSSIEIGSGTTVKIDSSVTQAAALWISCTGSATIAGTINIDGSNNSFNYGDQVKTTWSEITGPGVANGGGGGGSGLGGDGSGGSQGNGFGGGAGGGAAYNVTGPPLYTGYGGSGGNGGLNMSSSPASGGSKNPGPGGQNGSGGGVSGGAGGGAAAKTSGASGIGGQGGYWAGYATSGQGGFASGSSSNQAAGGGGGGGGGRAGKQGIHFYLYADTIDFTGTINTSGTSGTNGGNGGDGAATTNGTAFGGGGGGGGGGGNAGNIKFHYVTSAITTGTKTMTGGSAGTGGTGGAKSFGGNSISGGNGTAGSNGTFTSEPQTASNFPSSDPQMYIFGTTYNVSDDDSIWTLKKQANDDWIVYDDDVPYATQSAANNILGVSISGSTTTNANMTYDWKLYPITIGGRARMRIEANAYIQTFLESR